MSMSLPVNTLQILQNSRFKGAVALHVSAWIETNKQTNEYAKSRGSCRGFFSFALMSILSELLFAFMGRNLPQFAFSSTGHFASPFL
jgi:hypothetical protein